MLKAFSGSVEASIGDIRQILDRRNWNRLLSTLEDILKKADSTLKSADKTISQLEQISSGKREEIETAIDDFKAAMVKANVLLEKRDGFYKWNR